MDLIGTPAASALLAAMLTASVVAGWWRPAPRQPGDSAAPPTHRPAHAPGGPAPRPRDLVAASVGAVAVLLAVLSPPLAVAVAVVGWIGARHHSRRAQARAAEARQAALPELIDALVALVHAGLTPALGWRRLPASCPPALVDAVVALNARMDRGQTFADALAAFADDIGPAAHPLVDSLTTAERYGLPLGPVLDRLAAEAAAQRRRDAEARARQLPVRLSVPLVVCTLPSFVLLGVVPVLAASLSQLPRP